MENYSSLFTNLPIFPTRLGFSLETAKGCLPWWPIAANSEGNMERT